MKEIKAVSFRELIKEDPSFERAVDEIADFSETRGDDMSTFYVDEIPAVIEYAKEWYDIDLDPDLVIALENLKAVLTNNNIELILWD